MTQTPLNIIDLLMGDLNGPGAVGIAGKAGNAPQDAGLFGDIINSYLSSTVQAGNLLNLVNAANGPNNPDAANLPEMPIATVPENVAEFNRQLMAMLPQQTSDISANVKNLISQLPTELEPGKYEILSSQVQDGTVSLDLASKDNPLLTVKVTLPAEDLNLAGITGRTAINAGMSDQRVALDSDVNRMNDILSRLNLKEIEVESVKVSKTTTEIGEPVKISIVAEGTTGEVLIKSRLDKSRIRAVTTTPNNATESGRTNSGNVLSVQPENDFLRGKLLAGNTKGNTNIGTRTLVAQPDLSDPFTGRHTGSQKTETQQLYDTVFGYESTGTEEKMTSGTTSGKAVRLNLPQDFSGMLKANGRSVTLQLEPEHLGPARLSLSMSGDKLRARIVVESTPAKTALEADVDRLMTQLAKADIKVDQIEITLSQDNAHNEFLRRQPHWRHRMVNRMPEADDVLSETVGTVEAAASAPTREYVGPAGVNLFA